MNHDVKCETNESNTSVSFCLQGTPYKFELPYRLTGMLVHSTLEKVIALCVSHPFRPRVGIKFYNELLHALTLHSRSLRSK